MLYQGMLYKQEIFYKVNTREGILCTFRVNKKIFDTLNVFLDNS